MKLRKNNKADSTMTFTEAYKSMLKGYKVQCVSWDDEDFIYINDGIILCDGEFPFADKLTVRNVNSRWKLYPYDRNQSKV